MQKQKNDNYCNDDCCSRKQEAQEINSIWKNKKFVLLLISIAIIVPMEILSLLSVKIPLFIELPISIILLIVFGRDVFVSGIKSLLKLKFSSINLLMTIAVFGALYLGQFEEAVTIVVLFALAETLEEIGIKKSKKALEELIQKTPKTVLKRGDEDKTPIEDINIGDIIIVKPGDTIALDGVIVSGSSLVDEATITGEPIPETKGMNDLVYAGTVNIDGSLEIKVMKKSGDSTIAKIIEMTASANKNKSKSQEFIERFAKYYTPAVMVIASLIVIIPVVFLGLPFNTWFIQALSLLVISCPCALVISTPIAVFSALGNANRQGILIKGGKYLEELGKIKAIAFDKTRTLTTGEIRVSDIVTFNGYSEKEILACAAGLEIHSGHPLAKGILDKARELGVTVLPATDFKSLSGKGIIGHCSICKTTSCLGNLSFVENEIKIDEQTRKAVDKFEKEGKTTIIVANKTHIEGVIAIEDTIRNESKPLISFLKQAGITPIMLTGDNESTARYVASNIGLSKVYSSLLPENKVTQVQNLKKEYSRVAMVGDGINDAPSLAISNVGITLGSVGSDMAIENADIAIMDDNIGKIPFLIVLGKKVRQTIKFNIGLALAIKFLFVILALSGLSNLAFAIFADVGVSIIVIFSSLALYGFKPKNLFVSGRNSNEAHYEPIPGGE
ncbi:MAG: cation-translocating P-type ATPase [Patescibacteria group bacterium]|jgi:Cd2+/Zn2+-exporting ATPase